MTTEDERRNNTIAYLGEDSDSFSLQLPAPPERPLDSDCCGNGCVPCVLDIYREEMALWEAECERIRAVLSRDDGLIQEHGCDQVSSVLIGEQTVIVKPLKCKAYETE